MLPLCRLAAARGGRTGIGGGGGGLAPRGRLVAATAVAALPTADREAPALAACRLPSSWCRPGWRWQQSSGAPRPAVGGVATSPVPAGGGGGGGGGGVGGGSEIHSGGDGNCSAVAVASAKGTDPTALGLRAVTGAAGGVRAAGGGGSLLVARYRALTSAGADGSPPALREDPAQAAAVEVLDTIAAVLPSYLPRQHAAAVAAVAAGGGGGGSGRGGSGGGLGWGGGSGWRLPWRWAAAYQAAVADAELAAVAATAPRGAYLWGGVGVGKTFLADLMVEGIASPAVRRVHLAGFMLDFHARVHAHRAATAAEGAARADHDTDVVEVIASRLAAEAGLLCVDEFQVTDVADAVVLRRLFDALFRRGVVLVATSNREPSQLYINGLARELFVPLIPLLHKHTVVHRLASPVDYRLARTAAAAAAYKVQDDAAVERLFDQLSGIAPPPPADAAAPDAAAAIDVAAPPPPPTAGAPAIAAPARLSVGGRLLTIPRAVVARRTALFTFEQLCGRPLGTADYRALAAHFRVVAVTGLPILDPLRNRNEARRWIHLVDALYECRVKLFVSGAADSVAGIFGGPSRATGASVTEEMFAADRTVSRLLEMGSADYMRSPWAPEAAGGGRVGGGLHALAPNGMLSSER
ncbi:hypothetical protein MMPV_001009 [Pyropia vietnamensis]